MPYNVLDKLLGGAHLMLPGIYTSSLPEYWDVGDVSYYDYLYSNPPCGPLEVSFWELHEPFCIYF